MPSKIRASMKQVLTVFLLPLALGLAVPAHAERADRNQPMNVEADALRYDDLRQTSVFTGRVVVTKGTIVIRGARLDVRQDPEGFQYGVVTAEPGKRAFYRQKREGVDEFIEGEAEVIGYDGRAVRHNGRLYRPVHKGHVRVLDGQSLATHQTALEGIESWNYYVGPGGPLGYGTGGVYALDDRLVPVRKLIDAGGDRGNRRPYSVPLMAAEGRTLAVAVYRSDQPVVQVWSADGREKVREEPAFFGGAAHAEAGRLTAMGGGYLLSGDELAWVPADRQRPPWRFALQPLPRRPMRHHSLHDLGFGVPRLVGGKLFVACRDGGIFVFDPDRVTAPGGKP